MFSLYWDRVCSVFMQCILVIKYMYIMYSNAIRVIRISIPSNTNHLHMLEFYTLLVTLKCVIDCLTLYLPFCICNREPRTNSSSQLWFSVSLQNFFWFTLRPFQVSSDHSPVPFLMTLTYKFTEMTRCGIWLSMSDFLLLA